MKMLALSFLLLIGVTLLAEGFGQHVSKGYIYFAMGFSVFVEMLNLRLQKTAARPVHLRESLSPALYRSHFFGLARARPGISNFASNVLPRPATSVGRPAGKPPPVISSSPRIPVLAPSRREQTVLRLSFVRGFVISAFDSRVPGTVSPARLLCQ